MAMRVYDSRMAGRKGGRNRSPLKKQASRANGKLGGRPVLYPPCIKRDRHRFYSDVCKRCGFSREPFLYET